MMAIEYHCPNSMRQIINYYKRIDDFSFLNIKCDLSSLTESNNHLIYKDFLNIQFKKDFDLPSEYHAKFCSLNLDNYITCIKTKQYILKKTGIYPKNYNKKHMLPFMELLCVSGSKDKVLPKDLILLIAGYLFR